MATHLAANRSLKSTDLHQLHDTIESMDEILQEGCSEIIATAKLALAFFERADVLNDIETIALAFRAIWTKAEDMKNDINFHASELGSAHIDSAARRRSEAQQHTLRGCTPTQ